MNIVEAIKIAIETQQLCILGEMDYSDEFFISVSRKDREYPRFDFEPSEDSYCYYGMRRDSGINKTNMHMPEMPFSEPDETFKYDGEPSTDDLIADDWQVLYWLTPGQ